MKRNVTKQADSVVRLTKEEKTASHEAMVKDAWEPPIFGYEGVDVVSVETLRDQNNRLTVVSVLSNGEILNHGPTPRNRVVREITEYRPNRRKRRAYIAGLNYLKKVPDECLPVPRELLAKQIEDFSFGREEARSLIEDLQLEANSEKSVI